MAFSAGRRTREIGIRVALGASRSGILRMMFWEALRLAILGITVGLLLAATASRLIAGWLFNLSPLDARTFVATAALLLRSPCSQVTCRRSARPESIPSSRSGRSDRPGRRLSSHGD